MSTLPRRKRCENGTTRCTSLYPNAALLLVKYPTVSLSPCSFPESHFLLPQPEISPALASPPSSQPENPRRLAVRRLIRTNLSLPGVPRPLSHLGGNKYWSLLRREEQERC
ncbi:hypothetical protein CEXT_195001 [Caerostris extrusa]|uniref:Uncharacterized protein n=1 Tax=Caerostris extrusa TaxID=172846 RepID=A0AAV4M858_CAEEX|nr:hypothetical protein CEXT_195001 [Caerostris extrusa]